MYADTVMFCLLTVVHWRTQIGGVRSDVAEKRTEIEQGKDAPADARATIESKKMVESQRHPISVACLSSPSPHSQSHSHLRRDQLEES
jgi:hypothetical protein